MECKFCGKEFEKATSLANHTRWCDKNHTRIQKPRKTIFCTKCGIQFTLINPSDRRKTCSTKCAHHLSDEAKKHLSEVRNKFLAEHPEAHNWKKQRKKSVPCENVKQYLRSSNIEFLEEFTPSTIRHYAIDIAFPNLKIGIEINGNQHYNSDGTLADYYQKRHDFIESLGWKLLEIHFSNCFDEDNIKKIFNFEIPFNSNLEVLKVKDFLNRPKKKTRTRAEYQVDRLNASYEKWALIKDDIFNFGIDFSKLGWVNKVAEVIKIKPQKVNEWMKRHQADFYENHCLKRKTPKRQKVFRCII